MAEYNPLFMDALNNERAISFGLDRYNIDSNYRVVGGEGAIGDALYRDILKTGQVRGSPTFGGSAFFSRGLPQSTYFYEGSNPLLNNNYLIEATKDFNPNNNPLYRTNSERFGSRWIEGGEGTYSFATPQKDTSFIQRINPANQRGLKLSQANTGKVTISYEKSPLGIELFEGGAPKWKTVFDYTKPFNQTSLPTHGKNLIHIGKTVLEQPEVARLANKANTFANYAGIIPLAASEIERKKSDYQNPVTQEYFTKDNVTELDGLTYESATPKQIAMFHPDNADEHPEITDEMRKKFYPKWFK